MNRRFGNKLRPGLPHVLAFGSNKVEVLSFGISGYGTAQELLTLRQDVWNFSPDLVMTLFFAGNDVSDNVPQIEVDGRGMGNTLQPYFKLHEGELKLETGAQSLSFKNLLRRFLMSSIHYSRLLELANQVRRSLYARQYANAQDKFLIEPGLAAFTFAPPTSDVERDAWAVTDALITQMNNEVSQRGAEFLLVSATASIQVEPDAAKRAAIQKELKLSSLNYPEQHLSGLGASQDINVLTLSDTFQSYAESNNVYLHGFKNTRLGMGHWNDKGHALAAEVIASRICGSPTRLVHSGKTALNSPN